jgi:hypothetical protein
LRKLHDKLLKVDALHRVIAHIKPFRRSVVFVKLLRMGGSCRWNKKRCWRMKRHWNKSF